MVVVCQLSLLSFKLTLLLSSLDLLGFVIVGTGRTVMLCGNAFSGDLPAVFQPWLANLRYLSDSEIR